MLETMGEGCEDRFHISWTSIDVFTIGSLKYTIMQVLTPKYNQAQTIKYRFLTPTSDSWLASIPPPRLSAFNFPGDSMCHGGRILYPQIHEQASTQEATKGDTSQGDPKSGDRILILPNCFPCRVTTVVNWEHVPWD